MAGRDGGVPLVGRQDELGAVQELLDGTRVGRGGVLLLVGDAGVGKSTLARAAAGTADVLGGTVRFGRCVQLEIERPFHGVYDALGTPALGRDPIARTVLEAGALAATRFLVAEQLVEQVETLVAAGPTLLVIEDLHWADPSTLDVVRTLAERAPDLGLALLLTSRPPLPGTPVQRLVDLTPAVDRVEIGPLDDGEIAALVARATGSLPDRRLASALGLAAGNPLLVLAVLDALDRSSALEQRGSLIELIGEVPEMEPGTTITSRLSELSGDVLHVAQAAAVLGLSVRPVAVATMLERSVADVVDALERARLVGVFVVEGDSYAFRHELHRTAVLRSMTPPALSALHVVAARTLIELGAPAVEIAEHFAIGASQGDREAVVWLQRAADDLVDHAPGTALRLVDIALDLSGDAPSPELLLARVRALAGTGRTAETEELASSLLREGLDASTEAQLHRELAFSYLVQGRFAESVGAIERHGELAHDRDERGRVLAEIAFGRFVNLDQAGAREMATAALEEGLRAGDLAAQVGGGGVLCWLEEFVNRFESALELADRITTLAAQPHAVEASLYQPWFVAALVHLEADRFDALDADTRRGREVALSTGFAWSLPGYDAMTAYGLLRRGELDDALAVASSTLGYLDGVDGFGVALWCHAFLAQIALHHGDETSAEQHLAVAEEHLTTGRAQFGFEQSMIAKARLAERRDDPETSFAVYAATWDVYGGIGVLAGRQALGPDLVRLACAADDAPRVTEVLGALDEGARTSGLPAFRAFSELAEAWHAGDADRAAGAAALMATTGRRPTTAAMLHDVASMLRSAGRSADADAFATRSVELYRDCGADADAEAVACTIVGRAPRPRERPRFGFDALTPTERQVADLVAEGLSNGEIAARLSVSRRTVETHVSAAYRKLEVASRVELARAILESD